MTWEESNMDMVMGNFDKVRKVVSEWMKPTCEEWDNNRFGWSYCSEPDNAEWECFNIHSNDEIKIGVDFAHHNCIEIWTGKRDNVNIFISERGIVFNSDSGFIGFSHKELFTLWELLGKEDFRNDSEKESEQIMNDNLEKESKDTGIKIDDYRLQLGVVTKTKFDLNFFELYKAYAIYDRANACRHGILTSANENDLAFCTYGTGALRTDILIDIDEYLDGEYKIIPLIDNEQ